MTRTDQERALGLEFLVGLEGVRFNRWLDDVTFYR